MVWRGTATPVSSATLDVVELEAIASRKRRAELDLTMPSSSSLPSSLARLRNSGEPSSAASLVRTDLRPEGLVGQYAGA